MNLSKHLSVILILSLVILGGCTSKANYSIVKGASASWEVQPLAVRQTYPKWMQHVYMTAQMQTSDIQTWEVHVIAINDLGEGAKNAFAELRYTNDGEVTFNKFPLHLKEVDPPTEAKRYYHYVYQFGDETKDFYEAFMLKRFDYEYSPIDFHYIQPLYEKGSVDTSNIVRIEYAILPEYGVKTVGELMRTNFRLNKKDWVSFCSDAYYIYRKDSACGEITLTDLPSD
jgi:hypothetical protein